MKTFHFVKWGSVEILLLTDKKIKNQQKVEHPVHHHHLHRSCCDALGRLSPSSTCNSSSPSSSSSSFFFFRIIAIMDSRVTPWFKRKRVSQVKTDYAFQHATHTVQQRTERYQGGVSCCFAPASTALATVPAAAAAELLQSCFRVGSLLICCCCILNRAVCKILEEIVSCTQSASWHLE